MEDVHHTGVEVVEDERVVVKKEESKVHREVVGVRDAVDDEKGWIEKRKLFR
jgi:hypothetical protein